MSESTGTAQHFLRRSDLELLVRALGKDGRRVIGPTVRDGTVMLDEINSSAELPIGWTLESGPGRSRLVRSARNRVFDQPPGPSSWKRWTYPPRVTQFEWLPEAGSPVAGITPADPLALVGVRACEIAALRTQDRVLLGGPVVDTDYAARRADNLVVAVECAVAGKTCFCSSMGTGPEVIDGFDVCLSEIDDGFVVRAGSEAGTKLLAELPLTDATDEQVAAARASVAATREMMGTPLPMQGLPERLKAASESPRWAQIAERCLACTNCTLVCPTCFCTSVGQRSDLDGSDASSVQTWDSCFSAEFGRVAGGNFRTRVEDRYRQWLTHKFGTWWDQFGMSGCVGCGRCISWCPVAIDVREELMAVAWAAQPADANAATALAGPVAISPEPNLVQADVAEASDSATDEASRGTAAATTTGAAAPGATPAAGSLELPWRTATVVDAHRETTDVVTLRLRTDDARLLAGQPGQFVMAGLPAVAAPPISISRFHDDGFELTVRAAGAATARICALERGDTMAVRGPMGRGWPVKLAEGRDVMIITGGIGLAPLRPLIDWLLAHRERIARIHLAYGARTPHDRLYVDELDRLAADGAIDIAQTVDRAGPDWLGRVGVVTQVIDRVMCSCDRTIAFVCGPERMMKATTDVLHERGVPDERIYVTLERHMDCGVGLCGHCQLGRFFICHDGPVFSLAELGNSLDIEGL